MLYIFNERKKVYDKEDCVSQWIQTKGLMRIISHNKYKQMQVDKHIRTATIVIAESKYSLTIEQESNRIK